MSCAIEEELTAYVDGELSEVEAKKVASHLPGCAECQKTEALLRRTVEQLSALGEFEPSSALRRNVLAAVDAIPPSPWARLTAFFRPAYLAPLGGLCAAALVALIALHHGHKRPTPELANPADLELAMNYDVLDNYEVLGVDSPEDLEVVENLQELEKTP